MATSPTPSLESIPGANSIGSFGEHNDYLSDSPLTLSGSSPPVSDSAICDDFSSSGQTSSLESHHQTNSSASSSSASSTSSSGISSTGGSSNGGGGGGSGNSGSGGGPGGGGLITNGTGGTRCTGCKSKQSDAVAKCIDCVNYLCSNCVTAHQFMHCFDGHSVFRINAFDNSTTTPLGGCGGGGILGGGGNISNSNGGSTNCLSDIQTNSISFLMQQQQQQQTTQQQPQSQLSKLMMNGFDGGQSQQQSRFSLKDEPITKLAMSSLLNGGPPSSNSNDIILTSTTTATNGTTNSSKQTSQYFCTRHKNELLKFFCRTCSIPVCKDCMVMDHPTGLHECEHVQDATPKQIESLLQIVAEVRSKASDMRQIIKNSEHNTSRIQVQYHKAQNEINETYQFFRSMIDERKQELFKELESFYNAKNMSHSVLLTKSQEHIEKVLQSCDCVERITKHAGLTETVMLRKLMENKLQSFVQFIQELQSTCELDFVSNYQAIQVSVRNTFGYIRSSADIPTAKQPPIARPTSNSMLTGSGGSSVGSNGSLNAPLSGVGSSLLGGGNGSCQSVLDRPFASVAATTGNVLGGGGGGGGGVGGGQQQQQQISFDSNIISKRFNSVNSLGPFVSDINLQVNPYEKWSNGGTDNVFNGLSDQYTLPIGTAANVGVQNSVGSSTPGPTDSMIDLTSKLLSTTIFPPKSQIKRQKMIYHCKFGEFGVMEGQFTEPSGVAVNAQNDIIVADTNNHRIQIFDKEGRFKFQFGECGKRDGQLLYPNRVAVVRNSGDIIVTERSPTHQIQIYNQYGQFVRKFGANILQHPRGVTVDNKGRIIVVECKVMRVIIFDQSGNVLQKFGCSKHLEFPNGVVVNDKQEIFISDNRAHCVKVFNYEGSYLRQIGGEGITNYPIGVGINAAGEILIADNHNNFNLTIFTQDGQLVSALESKVKHAQCFDVALMDDGSVVLASKDYRLYIYRYVQVKRKCSLEEFALFYLNFIRIQTDGLLRGNTSSSSNTPRRPSTISIAQNLEDSISPAPSFTNFPAHSSKSVVLQQRVQQPEQQEQEQQQESKVQSLHENLHTTKSSESSKNPNKKLSKTISPIRPNNARKNLEENLPEDASLHLKSTPQKFSSNLLKDRRKLCNQDFSFMSPSSQQDTESPSRSFDSRFSSGPTTPNNNNSKLYATSTPNRITPHSGKIRNNSEKNKSPAALCLGDFIVTSVGHKRKTPKDGGQHVTATAAATGDATKSPAEPGNKNLKSQQNVKKPTRRVVPTPLGSTITNTFTSPAFRHENNILEMSKDEFLERDFNTIRTEREVLKDQITAITKEFQEESSSSYHQQNLRLNLIKENFQRTRQSELKIDLSAINNKQILDRFIEIHSALIDLNLTTNILNEVSYLLNLFNVSEDAAVFQTTAAAASAVIISNPVLHQHLPQQMSNEYVATMVDVGQIDTNLINRTDNEFYTVLKSLPNCIYYALRVLEKQKHLLALLDVTTLRVVLDSKRLDYLCKELKDFLTSIYNYKSQLEGTKSNHETSFRIGHQFTNVFYQQENDTRHNFPSDKEFGAFKKQRDMFYSILKIWEAKHLNPLWDFATELGSKVNALLRIMDHPINMAHLSKLFTSQLIISSNFSELPSELEIASLNINKDKLAKLRQRLVAPSDFSTDYQFPGSQAFFKDFIMSASSIVFLEQLKVNLIAELVDKNGSFYETISLSFTLDDKKIYNEYLVRPETVVTMQVLGKFLGLVTSKPFVCENSRSSLVDNKQIELRNMMQPEFNVLSILQNAIAERKMLITIPWLVQYISMLDYVTLRLNYYREVINLLYDIYLNLSKQKACKTFQIRPTSVFILRCCLGWLFDRPRIFEDFYTYSQKRQLLLSSTNDDNFKILSNFPQLHDDNIKKEPELTVKKSSIDNTNENISTTSQYPANDVEEILKTSFDPLLESILNVACPFLADFRVAIMPAKVSKRTSRSGRYRYVTTKMFEASTTTTTTNITPTYLREIDDPQTKLTEAFLHSQTLSVRRTVEFVTERTTSAVIKDFQIEILLPSKNEAMENIKGIEAKNIETLAKKMLSIFSDSYGKALQKWHNELEKNIENRVKMAMEAMLPHEIHDTVKRTCSAIVIKKCKTKAEDWRIANLSGIEFYSKDINTDAEKLFKNLQLGKHLQSTALEITDLSGVLPSKVFEQLQYLLYYTYCRPELVKSEVISKFCSDILECMKRHTLPTSACKLSATMTIYLIQNLVRKHYHIVTDDLIENFIKIWSSDKLKSFITFVEEKSELSKDNAADEGIKDEELDKKGVQKDSSFDALLTDTFIRSLQNKSECYECLTKVLIHLVNSGLISLNYLNEQFVALYKENWPEDTLKKIVLVLENITQQIPQQPEDDQKSQLFMEMLADFARDIDDY